MALGKKGSRKGLGVTRRSFLKSTGVGLLVPNIGLTLPDDSQQGPAGEVRFAPDGEMTRISANLFVLHDTCSVYVLKNGDRAILIDFGSGHVLNLLGQI